MSQACIEEYFVHKKRKAVTQDAGPKKVLLLDSPSSAASAASDSKVARPRNVINSPVKCSVSVKETRRAVIKLNFDSNPVPVPPVTLETSASVSSPKSVKFVKRGGLSPKKRGPPKVGNIEAYFIKKNNELGKDAEAREDNKIPDQVKEKKKEPTLEELGRKLCKGGRLAELKNSIQKLSEGFAQLDRLKSPSKTALKEFKEIEVLVPQRYYFIYNNNFVKNPILMCNISVPVKALQ